MLKKQTYLHKCGMRYMYEVSPADAGDDEIDPFDSGIIVSTNPADDSGIDDVLSEAEGTTVINTASDTHCTCMHAYRA